MRERKTGRGKNKSQWKRREQSGKFKLKDFYTWTWAFISALPLNQSGSYRSERWKWYKRVKIM